MKKKSFLTLFLVLFCFSLSWGQVSIDVPLTITDNSGGTQIINFGLASNATDGIDVSLGEATLPPMPPAGVFDARFNVTGNESTLKDYRQGSATFTGEKIHEIQYQVGTGSTIIINWNMPAGVTGRLQDVIIGTLIDVQMAGTGSYTVTNPASFNKLKLTAKYGSTQLDVPVLVSPVNNATNVAVNPTLKWRNATGAAKYQVQVSTSNTFATTVVDDNNVVDTLKSISGLNYLTDYYWRVRSINGTNQSDWSSVSKLTTIIEKPVDPVLATPVNNATGLLNPITVTWNAALRAESYTLQVSTLENFSTTVVNETNITATNKVLPNLNNYTKYYWRVKAVNVGGESNWSSVNNYTMLGTPQAISLVYPENNAINVLKEVTFKWRKGISQESEMKYWFELSTDTTGTSFVKDTTLTDTVKILTLENNKKYYWKVKAKNQVGWGQFSSWVNFTTIVDVPSVVTLVSPSNNSVGVVINPILKWRKSTFASKYALQVSSDPSFATTIVNDTMVTDTVKQISQLQYKTIYYWRVKAINIAGTSNYSNSWKFTTHFKPIATPTNLVASPTKVGEVKLMWQDNSDNELGFAILRKLGDSTSVNQLVVIDSVGADVTTYLDLTVLDTTKYSYKVVAFNADTLSKQSYYATVFTLTGITELTGNGIPDDYVIEQNYPNPFNPSTTIRYGLPYVSNVKLEIYDIIGRRVQTILNDEQNAGYYQVDVSFNNLASGIYFYLLEAKQVNGNGKFREAKKMILMK